MFCANCGAKLDKNVSFCTQCGAPRPALPAYSAPHPTAPPANVKKSSNTALLVALIVIGALMFLGVIAAIAVPNLLTAKEMARVKNTKRDVMTVSAALAEYVTDNGTLPSQSGRIDGYSEIAAALSPFYLKILPTRDAWDNDLLVYCGEACNGQYGLRDCQADDYLVVSLGKDGDPESWAFDPDDSEAGLYVHSRFHEFDRDLVIFNGSWIRASSR